MSEYSVKMCIFASKINGKMKLHIINIYIGLLMGIGMLVSSCGNSEERPPMESVILNNLKQRGDIVTTEVRVRKLAIYDSSQHERVVLRDPRTWKWGERKCIVPVDVTIKYGYDLRELTVDDVKLSDDSTAVVILLPEPKIIDSGYEAKVEESQVVRMSSGMRDRIGHEEVDELMRRTYRAVMEQNYTEMVDEDIERNARVVFEGIVRGLGMKNASVEVMRRAEWKDGKVQK